MIVTRVVRPTFRVERTFVDVHDREKREHKVYLSEWGAYMQAARWAVFAVRDRLPVTDDGLCELCAALQAKGWSSHEDGPPQCRWHSDRGFEKKARRAARWLRWRDRFAERTSLASPNVRAGVEKKGGDNNAERL